MPSYHLGQSVKTITGTAVESPATTKEDQGDVTIHICVCLTFHVSCCHCCCRRVHKPVEVEEEGDAQKLAWWSLGKDADSVSLLFGPR